MKQRKKLYVRFAVLFAAIFSVGCVFMAACGKKDDTKDTEPGHTHSYSVTESKDPTCTEDGYVTYTCECGDTYTETVKSTGHSWDQGTVTKGATCTAEGVTTYTCTVCGETKTETISKTEHTYVEKDITWKWTWDESKGYTDVTATAKCSVCQTETTVDGEITSKPTDGIYGDYTATAEFGGKSYSDTQTAVGQGGSSGSGEVHTHIYGTPTWTWDEENYSYATATFTCTDENCPDEDGQKIVEVKAEGSAVQQTVTTTATCGTAGSCTYTATVTVSFGEGTYSDTTATVTIPATGVHEYTEIDGTTIEWEWADDYSSCKATVTVQCKNCTATMTYTDYNCTVDTDAEKSQASTCKTNGHVVYTAAATLDNQTYNTETGAITLDLAPHTLTKVEAANATCEVAGHSEYWVCSVCGKMFSDADGKNETSAEEIVTDAATGHEIVGTYADGVWTYTCTNDSEESFVDLQSIYGAINSVALTVTDETTFAAAGAWNESVDVVPVIDVNSTATITLSSSVYVTGYEKVIILNTDVTVGSCALVIETAVTLDLNGHTMEKTDSNSSSGTVQVGAYSPDAVYGNLTIKDTSTEGTGAIKGIWYPVTIFGVENTDDKVSVLTIESGNITSTSGVAVSSNGLYPALEIYIEGGKITNTSNYTAIYLPSGNLYVSGGYIEGATGIEIRGGSITVTGGEIVSNYTGNAVYGSGTNGPVTRGYAIAENHPEGTSNYPDMTGITISGGTIIGTLIFTEAGKALVAITGGLFSVSPAEYLEDDYSAKYDEDTGYYVVQSFVDDYTIEISADGKTAITLETCGCGEDEESFVTWTVTVTKDGVALTDAEVVWTSSDETVATVSGGVITAAGNNGTVTITATYVIDENHAISASINITVSLGGHDLVGTYDEDTSSWVYTCANDTSTTPREIAFSERTPVKSVTLAVTDEVSFSAAGAWNESVAVVPIIDVNSSTGITISDSVYITGCEKKIVLNGDVTADDCAVVIETTVTLDLNGHTMEKINDTKATGTIQIGAYSPDAVYGNLTIIDTSAAGNGSITGTNYPVTIFGVENTEGKVSVLTVESGNITTASGVPISSNGLYSALEIYVKGGKINNTSNYTAIYLPSGDLYVSGGHIEGATGIEIRGGSITMTGGEIASNYTGDAVYGSGTNGPVTRGYVIAENHPEEKSNYPEVTRISISGGIITGTMIFNEAGKEVVSITGGFYSKDPSDFLGDEYIAVESTTMEGYFEIADKPEATVTGLAIAEEDKSITLDVINGEEQREITVYILLSDGAYKTYTSGLTWTYDGTGTVDIDYNGSSATITASVVGEGTITISLDGTEYYIEIAVEVIDSSVDAAYELVDHKYSFKVSEVKSTVEAYDAENPRYDEDTGDLVTDINKFPLQASFFETDSNSFLTYIGNASDNTYRTDSNGCIEVKGEAFEVTFIGTGTLTISFRSNGSSKISSLALRDSSGYYVQGILDESATNAYEKEVANGGGYYYVVTDASNNAVFISITFTIDNPGTYTIVTSLEKTVLGLTDAIDDGRVARINGIVMVDAYEELVVPGESSGESTGDGVGFFPPFIDEDHGKDSTTEKNNVITENDLFKLTNIVKIKYKEVTTSFTDSEGNTVDVTSAISTSSSTKNDSVISVTANEDITLYLYFSLGDSSFGSAKEGTLNYSIADESMGSVEVSGKNIVTISVSLQKGETLTISVSASDNVYVWFFGAEAVQN